MSEATKPSPPLDFNRAPYLILWELTRACALACQHCRAKAIRNRSPLELTEAEVTHLLRELTEFGKPLIVLTGGDPIQRPDIFEIIEEARRNGFTVAMTPSATPSVTEGMVKKLKKAGLERLAISIDGPNEGSHDTFRRVAGSFAWSLSIVSWARKFDLPIQINTTICRHNFDFFDDMARLVGELGAVLWSVFFLVTVGRARKDMQISAEEAESVLQRMAALSELATYDVKSTAAPHFRRVLIEKFAMLKERLDKELVSPAVATSKQGQVLSNPVGMLNPSLHLGTLRSYQSVNDGRGVLFISESGDIQPSGFLPITAGNVRTEQIVSVYREHKLFRALRDPSMLKGKCGICRYRHVCGGSRARAYGDMGDYLAADSLCCYYEKAPESDKSMRQS